MRHDVSEPIVTIDCFPQSAWRYREDHAVVCVDVIRSTTTAITAVALGRRCFPVPTLEQALLLSVRLEESRPLLAGEIGVDSTAGFGIANSPSVIAHRDDIDRPLILLSSSGTRLIHEASGGLAVFLACLRNYRSAAESLARRYRKIAILGAGSQDEFCIEDQMCCAWMAEILVQRGYRPGTRRTQDLIRQWHGAPADAIVRSTSVEYLKQTSQEADLEFILSHVDDIDASFMVAEEEVLMIPLVFSQVESTTTMIANS